MTAAALLTASTRWLVAIALLPLFGSGGRALLARLALALPLLITALPLTLPAAQDALAQHPLAPTLTRELLIGLIIGLIALITFSIGELIGALVDAPSRLGRHSGHARWIALLTLAAALFAGAHILFLEALLASYQSAPIGHTPGSHATALITPLFAVAFAATLPLLFALFTAELALGWALQHLQPRPAGHLHGAARQLFTALLLILSLHLTLRVVVTWLSDTLRALT